MGRKRKIEDDIPSSSSGLIPPPPPPSSALFKIKAQKFKYKARESPHTETILHYFRQHKMTDACFVD